MLLIYIIVWCSLIAQYQTAHHLRCLQQTCSGNTPVCLIMINPGVLEGHCHAHHMNMCQDQHHRVTTNDPSCRCATESCVTQVINNYNAHYTSNSIECLNHTCHHQDICHLHMINQHSHFKLQSQCSKKPSDPHYCEHHDSVWEHNGCYCNTSSCVQATNNHILQTVEDLHCVNTICNGDLRICELSKSGDQIKGTCHLRVIHLCEDPTRNYLQHHHTCRCTSQDCINKVLHEGHSTTTTPKITSTHIPSTTFVMTRIPTTAEIHHSATNFATTETPRPMTDIPTTLTHQPMTDIPTTQTPRPTTDVPTTQTPRPTTDIPTTETTRLTTDIPVTANNIRTTEDLVATKLIQMTTAVQPVVTKHVATQVLNTETNTPITHDPTPKPTVKPLVSSTYSPTNATQKRASCNLCGDFDLGFPCDIHAVHEDHVTLCPESHNFCMTDVFKDLTGNVDIFKRCVDQTTCEQKWITESANLDYCKKYGAVKGPENAFECHFCCVGEGCNSHIVPKQTTWYTK